MNPGETSRSTKITVLGIKDPLGLCMLVLCSALVPIIWWRQGAYRGSADLHASMEMCGAIIGIIAGMALISRFNALGNRIHLFIGLAFFVNAVEDFAHGFLAFEAAHGYLGLVEDKSDLKRFIPGTYVTGRMLFGFILVIAPFLDALMGESRDPRRETRVITGITMVVTVIMTVIAFMIPLPNFIFPEHVISRPVDMLSAIILLAAFVVHRQRHLQKDNHDQMTWWLLLAISINCAGQVIMSFSLALFDATFDLAHIYKIMGYAVPLLGFCLVQIDVIRGSEARRQVLLATSKSLEDARLHAESMAKEANAANLAKSTFLATMSHELRTPMNAIIGFTNRLQAKIGDELQPQHARALAIIGRNGDHLLQLINGILDLAKIEAGKMTYTWSRCDIHALCCDVCGTLESLATGKGLQMDVVLPQGSGAMVMSVDQTRMRQVVTNLVANAITYTKHGSVRVETGMNEQEAWIRVCDTGIGIAEADRQKLFQRFEQLEDGSDRSFGGAGLGLAVAAELVNAHGGHIEVASELGVGSVFTVHLPLENRQEQVVEAAAEAA